MQPALKYQIIQVTPFYQNCTVLYSEDSQDAVVIDPGGEAEKILKFLNGNNLKCKQIWLTHSHLDHCGGVADLKAATGAPVSGCEVEKFFRQNVEQIKMMYGIMDDDMKNSPEPEHYIDEKVTLAFNQFNFKILFTPGHSPGHLCFYHKESDLLIAGDTLFYDSIGRTDLPYGNHGELISSIRNKLLILPDETIVLPGHGEPTSIGREKKHNPFL